MSDRMTEIELPGAHRGFADWGYCEPADLIARLKEQAQQELDAARAVLDACDEDFRVATYIGPHARRQLRVIQPGHPQNHSTTHSAAPHELDLTLQEGTPT